MAVVELDRRRASRRSTRAPRWVRCRWTLPGLDGGRRPGDLPATELVLRGVGVDRARLAAYARVCHFRLGDTLPATYPHVLAFPLAMTLCRPRTSPSRPPGWCTWRTGSRCTGRWARTSGSICGCTPPTCVRTTAVASSTWSPRPPSRARRSGAACRRTCAGSAPPALPGHPADTTGRPPTTAGTGRAVGSVGPLAGPGAGRSRLRPGLRRPQPDPHLTARRAAVRLSAPDRARDVEQGALPGRPGGPAARRVHRRGGVQAAGPAAGQGDFTAVVDGRSCPSPCTTRSPAAHLSGTVRQDRPDQVAA